MVCHWPKCLKKECALVSSSLLNGIRCDSERESIDWLCHWWLDDIQSLSIA